MSTIRRTCSLSLVSALTITLRPSGPAAIVTTFRCAAVCRSRICGMMLVASALRSGISVTVCGSTSSVPALLPGTRRSPSSASMSAAPSATLCDGPTMASLPTSSIARTVGFTSLGSVAYSSSRRNFASLGVTPRSMTVRTLRVTAAGAPGMPAAADPPEGTSSSSMTSASCNKRDRTPRATMALVRSSAVMERPSILLSSIFVFFPSAPMTYSTWR